MQQIPLVGAEFARHDCTVHAARPSDIRELIEFVTRLSQGGRGERLHLLNTETGWRTLVEAQNVVCARSLDGRIAGFYAANHFDLLNDAVELGPVRSAYNVLCNRFRAANSSVAFGAAVEIDLPWQSSDLRVHLLRLLLRTVGLRYRYLFSVVIKDDGPEMQALPVEGWRCFYEEEDACYMVLDVARALRHLASRLVLHFPAGTNGVDGAVTGTMQR